LGLASASASGVPARFAAVPLVVLIPGAAVLGAQQIKTWINTLQESS
jgi:hypothetical protein